MNIVVCVKYVPDAQSDRTFTEADNTTDRVGVDGLLSELDEYAVEEALKIAQAAEGDSSVTVLTVGPEQAADAIRKALRMGADKGVHVTDEAIHGSDAPATSLVLAEAIRKIGARRPGPDRHGLDRRLHERRAGDAGRAPRAAAGDLRLRAHRRGRHGDHPPRRRRRVRDRAGLAARAGVGDRPDQRAALPHGQGDHGGQEEAGRDLVAGRPGRRRRARRPRRRRGPGWTRSPSGPRGPGARSSPDEGEGGTKLAEFLAAQKFI